MEEKQLSEILRTLAMILSQLDFEKKIKGTANPELIKVVSGTIKDLNETVKDLKLDDGISSLIEHGKFSEARSKLLELSYKLLERKIE